MSAITKKKDAPPKSSTVQIPQESADDILRRKQAVRANAQANATEEGRGAPVSSVLVGTADGGIVGEETPLTGLAAEKPVGALCFLPKSLHRLASRAAEDRDITSKRFFLETLLLGLEQQGVITPEQRTKALALPNEYGWKGRKAVKS